MAAKTIETLGFHAKHVRVMRCHLWFSARIEPRCQHGGSSEKLKPRTFFSRCVTVQQNDRKINFLHSYSIAKQGGINEEVENTERNRCIDCKIVKQGAEDEFFFQKQ